MPGAGAAPRRPNRRRRAHLDPTQTTTTGASANAWGYHGRLLAGSAPGSAPGRPPRAKLPQRPGSPAAGAARGAGLRLLCHLWPMPLRGALQAQPPARSHILGRLCNFFFSSALLCSVLPCLDAALPCPDTDRCVQLQLVGELVVDGGGRASAWTGRCGAAKLPERPLRLGEPDCDYYLKFGTCRLGEHCKFNHPLDRIYAEDPLLPLQHPAGSGSSSSQPESVVNADPDLSPCRLIAEEDPLLSLQHRADSGSSNSLPEAVLHVDAGLSPSRPAYDEDEAAEPLLLEHPADSGSNNQEQEDAVDVGAGISLQPEPSLPLQHPADSGIINQELEVAVDVCADVSLEAHPFLPLQYPADRGRNDSLPEVAVAVDAELSASTSTAQHVEDDVHGTPDDQIKEQQNRCTKYSKKVLVFAIVTFIDYAVSISSTRYTVLTKASMAALFVAICSDLFSLKMKPKWCALVYVSCFHLVLMTTLIFVSLNKDYAYAVLIVPLMIGAPLLQRKLWPQERQRSTSDDRADEKLDDIFNLAALILNGGSLTIALISIVRRFISGPGKPGWPGNYRTGCAAGFLLFFTVVVGLHLMMVTTVRHAALTLHAKYLHNLLIVLVVGTLITTLGPIWFH